MTKKTISGKNLLARMMATHPSSVQATQGGQAQNRAQGKLPYDNREAYYVLVYKSGETCPLFVARVKFHTVEENNDLLLFFDLDDNSRTHIRWYSYDWDYLKEISIEEYLTANPPRTPDRKN